MKPTERNRLFIITGASCIGKTTACEILFKNEKDYIVMESDLYCRYG
jgi:guanylate kinase